MQNYAKLIIANYFQKRCNPIGRDNRCDKSLLCLFNWFKRLSLNDTVLSLPFWQGFSSVKLEFLKICVQVHMKTYQIRNNNKSVHITPNQVVTTHNLFVLPNCEEWVNLLQLKNKHLDLFKKSWIRIGEPARYYCAKL